MSSRESKVNLCRFLAALAVLVAIRPALAAEPALDVLDAPVPFTAHFYVSSDKGDYQGQVWHVPGRERRDFDTAGGAQAVLLSRDGDAA